MKYRIWRVGLVVGSLLAAPAVVLGDFSIGEFPQFALDHAPDWLFQILSTILLAFVQVLTTLFGLGTTTG